MGQLACEPKPALAKTIGPFYAKPILDRCEFFVSEMPAATQHRQPRFFMQPVEHPFPNITA